MAGFFSRLKERFSGAGSDILHQAEEEGYVELGTDIHPESGAKITVRPFVIEDFESIKSILDSLREGHTIALINIKPLKDKDLVELKRAINKLKKTCDAIEGDIAGFGDNWIAAVPSYARIYRHKPKEEPRKEGSAEAAEYD
ncbi:cell division protein SepF [Candidatus Woesearchaeota archaeon]|nr:cell division protein SepF [Candidatus Woesearchaeota archaeon]